jgi:hypothetical protein
LRVEIEDMQDFPAYAPRQLSTTMKKEKAYFVYIHRYGFRAGEPAEILGVVVATPVLNEPRAAYHVRFADGHEDYIAIKDHENFEIISESDVKAGRIPAITR